ncbi:MAG TPA: HAMP domain-containing sensor histidine kinase [Gaiellaceae bacterium]|jgi:two-component system, OmpR family, phosphate regulon sensor histidine kinase PhoR
MENPELEAERGRRLLEESSEIVLVLDDEDRLVVASRRARETLDGLVPGQAVPEQLLRREPWRPRRVPVEVDGRRESLLYLREPGELSAYEELRAGFTAAVSHELRTPLARLLAILETAALPSAKVDELLEQGKAEVEQIRELIDDVLFLSELETGRAVVSLASTPAAPVVREVMDRIAERASRAGVTQKVELDEEALVPLRPRMLRVVLENLAENAIRYAGDGVTFSIEVQRAGDDVVIVATDDGVGVGDEDLPRLFERFYRADRARASRGTGLGLAIVKHIVTSAGGYVDASSPPGQGLEIRITFPG